MAKQYTGQPFNLALDPQTTKPLDVRMSIPTASARLLPDTWKVGQNYYVYPSMITVCKDSGSIYTYIGEENNPDDIADETKWVAAGKDNDGLSKTEIETLLSGYVLVRTLNTRLSVYALTSSLDDYLKIEDYIVDSVLSDTSENPVQNKVVKAAIDGNTSNIENLQTTVNSLLTGNVGSFGEWTILLKEESEMATLTSENTVEHVLYFGLEPLDTEEEEPDTPTTSTVILTGNTVKVTPEVTYSNNTVTVQNTSLINNTVTVN